MIKKIFPILIVFVFILSCGFYFFSRNPAAYVARTLGYLQNEDFSNAEKTLNALERDYPSYPAAFYRGYFAQIKKKFKEADRYFQELIDCPSKEISLHEVYLAKATNAFFEGRDDEMRLLIESAAEIAPGSYDVLFFQGLYLYLQKKYEEAIDIWTLAANSFSNNEWQEFVFNRLFPQCWRHTHLAHCLIEEGDIGSAQQLLEGGLRNFNEQDPKEFEGISYLFLGLASLKEARLFPVIERGSEYKLAHFYFERSTASNSYSREKAAVIDTIQKETKTLLQHSEFRPWGISFIKLLEDWKSQSALDDLAEFSANYIAKNSLEVTDSLLSAFQSAFFESSFKNLLVEKLVNKMSENIPKGDSEALMTIWGSVERLAEPPSSHMIVRRLSSEASNEMFRILHHDTEMLPKTVHFLDFWKQLEKDPASHLHLAHSLVGHSEMLWKKEGYEKKGTRLMEISLSLAGESEKLTLLREVEKFLIALYREAEEANMVRRLSLIYDALAYFNLGNQTLASPASLANHLADADYLFGARHFASAQTHAEWILKFEPNNQEALRLYGLSSFHLGDYKRSSSTLLKLVSPDEDSRKALILSKAFSSQPQDHQLAQRDDEEKTKEL